MSVYKTDASLKSWVSVPSGSDFPIQNLPYGVFQPKGQSPRAGVAIGTQILDLAALYNRGFLSGCGLPESNPFSSDTLNAYMALGRTVWTSVRARLTDLLSEGNTIIQNKPELFHEQQAVDMLMPVSVPDYTDFYSSLEHASNVGKMFRPDQPPLLPNWKHMPIGYHGRASSICVSGTPFHRPKGQTKPPSAEKPSYGPSRQLDIELETAFIIGTGNDLGTSISTQNAEDHIFGLVLFNDFSARDLQSWEYVPLGPFLGKNFFSSVSPWVVTLDALEPFRVQGPVQDEPVLDYLKFAGEKNYDIHLEVFLTPENGKKSKICHSNHKYLYWNMAQQLAHHTVNGCNMRTGDMCGSGTISAPYEGGYGSMLELSWRGTKPIVLEDGSTRTFIEDFDTITFRGYCEKDGLRVGFGELVNKILPSI
jgi:fumarylacetoacetase